MTRLPALSIVRQAGFTMIELLVVIAVIGVLAVAVLSSINPIEQINKGRDTRSRSDAAQMINAVDRYFSIHEEYPWNVQTADFDPGAGGTTYTAAFEFDETGIITGATTDWDWLDVLANTNEVKTGFINRIKADNQVEYMIVKDQGSNTTMYSCFKPTSYAFAQEAKKRCDAGTESDYPADACNPGGTECVADPSEDNVCYVCLP